ncbi:MAG: Trm112 family protein [Nanoarchaeota archaeon]|nr:Trm112 family protein [Nanoarchaeota archaeon]
MFMDDELLKLLACPDCRKSLKLFKDSLKCTGCNRVFKIKEGIPLLLPKSKQ